MNLIFNKILFSRARRSLIVVAIAAVVSLTVASHYSTLVPAARAVENLQFYPVETSPTAPPSTGRNLRSCLASYKAFFQAALGFESFKDYIRDFKIAFVAPTQYTDIQNIENQMNRSRYAVVASFLRCDTQRLESVTNAYRKLEAELYFVRYFADPTGGHVNIKISDAAKKDQFQVEFLDRLVNKVFMSESEREQKRAVYTGYFTEFSAKYAERGRVYSRFGNDSIYAELAAKWDEMMKTFKSLKSIGTEVANAGRDVGQAAVEAGRAAKKVYSSLIPPTKKGIKEAFQALGSKFEACVETPTGKACGNLAGKGKKEGKFFGSEVEKFVNSFTQGRGMQAPNGITFMDIISVASQQAYKTTATMNKAEMLARYELLYGQINGDGLNKVTAKIDDLVALLGQGRNFAVVEEVPSSLKAMEKVVSCAKHAKNMTCK